MSADTYRYRYIKSYLSQLGPVEVKSDLVLKHVVETSSTEELHSPVGDCAGPGCVIAVSDLRTVLPELTLEGKERHSTL